MTFASTRPRATPRPLLVRLCRTCSALSVSVVVYSACGDTTFVDRPRGADDTLHCSLVGCIDPNASLCDTMTGRCKPCREDTQCAREIPACVDGRCVECSESRHCVRFADVPICDERTRRCVQCTRDDQSACSGAALVCDEQTRTCTDVPNRRALPCEECASDDDCLDGLLCIPEVATSKFPTDTGRYCLRKSSVFGTSPEFPCTLFGLGGGVPELLVEESRTSVDGVTDFVCVPSETSCRAIETYNDDCAPSGKPDDALCGLPEEEDSVCIETSEGFRCRMI